MNQFQTVTEVGLKWGLVEVAQHYIAFLLAMKIGASETSLKT